MPRTLPTRGWVVNYFLCSLPSGRRRVGAQPLEDLASLADRGNRRRSPPSGPERALELQGYPLPAPGVRDAVSGHVAAAGWALPHHHCASRCAATPFASERASQTARASFAICMPLVRLTRLSCGGAPSEGMCSSTPHC